jgi:protein SCO1/2
MTPHPRPATACSFAALLPAALLALASVSAAPIAAQGMGANIPVVDDAASMADKLGTQIPAELAFTDSLGFDHVLGDLLGDRPVVLNLGYFSCPGVCQEVTNRLVETMAAADLRPGRDLDVWTISIDPREGVEMARGKKLNYLDLLGYEGEERDQVAKHWWFLTTGVEGRAAQLASTVGWRYRWNDQTSVFDHPPVIVLVSPTGKVTRYLDLRKISSTTLRRAVVEASNGQVGSFLERVYVSCLTWDPKSQSYSFAMLMMSIGGAVTLLALAGMILYLVKEQLRAKDGALPVPATTD